MQGSRFTSLHIKQKREEKRREIIPVISHTNSLLSLIGLIQRSLYVLKHNKTHVHIIIRAKLTS